MLMVTGVCSHSLLFSAAWVTGFLANLRVGGDLGKSLAMDIRQAKVKISFLPSIVNSPQGHLCSLSLILHICKIEIVLFSFLG